MGYAVLISRDKTLHGQPSWEPIGLVRDITRKEMTISSRPAGRGEVNICLKERSFLPVRSDGIGRFRETLTLAGV
jgi:hypothetical protein